MAEPLRFGFMPLFDAAPLLVARSLGLFDSRGLDVRLVREASWATVRDKLAVGALDGAHLLAPLALATHLGDQGVSASLIAPFTLNHGGAAITLNRDLAAGADELAEEVARRRTDGAAALTFAVVYPHALHNYLLRDWLLTRRVDPTAHVRIVVSPPSRMRELLEAGAIDGFCAGEPWSFAAEASGVGAVVARASSLQPDAIDKVFAFGSAMRANTHVLAAAGDALAQAADWAQQAANRKELLAILSAQDALGSVAEISSGALDDIRFAVAPPSPEAVMKQAEQMLRWAPVAPREDTIAASQDLFAPLT